MCRFDAAFLRHSGRVAQLVEHRVEIPGAGGSTPSSTAILRRAVDTGKNRDKPPAWLDVLPTHRSPPGWTSSLDATQD